MATVQVPWYSLTLSASPCTLAQLCAKHQTLTSASQGSQDHLSSTQVGKPGHLPLHYSSSDRSQAKPHRLTPLRKRTSLLLKTKRRGFKSAAVLIHKIHNLVHPVPSFSGDDVGKSVIRVSWTDYTKAGWGLATVIASLIILTENVKQQGTQKAKYVKEFAQQLVSVSHWLNINVSKPNHKNHTKHLPPSLAPRIPRDYRVGVWIAPGVGHHGIWVLAVPLSTSLATNHCVQWDLIFTPKGQDQQGQKNTSGSTIFCYIDKVSLWFCCTGGSY